MKTLTRNESRKYAVGMRRIEYGIWGYPHSLFYAVVLTTRAGDDNSTKKFGYDFQRLVAWLRKQYVLEYCGVFQLTPKKGLLHIHTIFRVKGGYFPLTRRELGDKWNEIHGAFVVHIKHMGFREALQAYITKDMCKTYVDYEGGIRNKFLVSSGWCRAGIKQAGKRLKELYCELIDSSWPDERGWKILNECLKCWAEGKTFRAYVGDGCIQWTGKYINSYIIGIDGNGREVLK